MPVVLVNSVAAGLPHPAITSDNVDGGRQAAAHLLDLGHRRIGVLTTGPRNADAPARVAGVRHAVADRGLDPDSIAVVVGEPGVAGGEEALCRLLDEAPATTGVIAYNDLMAIGAMRAVGRRGRTVPGDISVVGFDDIAIAAYADPPLTTIAQAIGDLGRWAVERLVERIADGGTATTDDGRARPACRRRPAGAARDRAARAGPSAGAGRAPPVGARALSRPPCPPARIRLASSAPTIADRVGARSRSRRAVTTGRVATPSRPQSSTTSEPAAAANRRSNRSRIDSRVAASRQSRRRRPPAQPGRVERGEERVPGPGRVDLGVARRRAVAQDLGRPVRPEPDQQPARRRPG